MAVSKNKKVTKAKQPLKKAASATKKVVKSDKKSAKVSSNRGGSQAKRPKVIKPEVKSKKMTKKTVPTKSCKKEDKKPKNNSAKSSPAKSSPVKKGKASTPVAKSPKYQAKKPASSPKKKEEPKSDPPRKGRPPKNRSGPEKNAKKPATVAKPARGRPVKKLVNRAEKGKKTVAKVTKKGIEKDRETRASSKAIAKPIKKELKVKKKDASPEKATKKVTKQVSKVVKKKKVNKVKLAQMQLKKMKSQGLIGAPPRRAASLNAAAMVHFMYDAEIASGQSNKAKPKAAAETEDKKPDVKQKKPESEPDVERRKKKLGRPPKIVKNKPKLSVFDSDHETTEDSDSEPEPPKKKDDKKKRKEKKKKKKTLKDEFNMDIRDMIVKKRIASLNASAIMTASYTQEVTKHDAPIEPAKSIVDEPKKAKKEAEKKTKKAKKEAKHIIVEIEDEKIKNQLIASAMKKASGSSKSSSPTLEDSAAASALLMMLNSPTKTQKLTPKLPPKKRHKKQREVVTLSSGESEHTDIEEIVTEGARATAAAQSADRNVVKYHAPPPAAPAAAAAVAAVPANAPVLKAEMNKVIVDGVAVGAGMYQVVQRFEHISTTTAVVPRYPGPAAANDQPNCDKPSKSSVQTSRINPTARGSKYTPLGALANLQPGITASGSEAGSRKSGGGGRSSGVHSGQKSSSATSSRSRHTDSVSLPSSKSKHTPYSSTISQEIYQPAGPLISASPTQPPPTATVQPTVVCTTASSKTHHPREEFRKQPPPPPPPPAAAVPPPTAGYSYTSYSSTATPGYPYPTYPPPPPAHAAPYPSFYPTAAPAPGFPPTPGAPPYPYLHCYPVNSTSGSEFQQPPVYAGGSAGYPPAPGSHYLLTPYQTNEANQLALSGQHHHPPHLPGAAAAYYYGGGGGGYSYPYASAAGRIIAPILALAPQHQGVPGHQTSVYSYSVQQQNPLAPGFPPGLVPPPATVPPQSVPQQVVPPQGVPQQAVQPATAPHPEMMSNKTDGKEREMQKRAAALAGKISATVTITTNSKKDNGFLTGAAPSSTAAATTTAPPPAATTPSVIPLSSGGLVVPSPSVAKSQLATITPIYSQTQASAAAAAAKSSLRDYRRPKKSGKSSAVPDEISVTAVVGPQKPKMSYQEPAVVSMYPVPPKPVKRASGNPEESASKKSKQDKFNFPKGLTVTEIQGKSNKDGEQIPVLHIPDDDRLPSMRSHLPPIPTGLQAAGLGRGHPGMPSGLLSVSSLRNTLQPPPSLQTHQPKASTQKRMLLKQDKKAATISISMAESAVSACVQPPPQFKPVRAKIKGKGASPGSSRSSSRNSSLSPRERSGSMSKSASPKTLDPRKDGKQSAPSKKRSPVPNGPLIPWCKRNNGIPKNCNGWQWEGEGKIQKVYLNNDDSPIFRVCYDSMKHQEGDIVTPRDCIVLASGHRKRDLPFIAKVTSLWENPEDGEMCMSLLWYYRPEHMDSGRKPDDLSDEIYASKHRDFTSVACIEDKCYVMTFNEYCRYRKFLRMVEQGVSSSSSFQVPEPLNGYDRAHLLPRCRVAPDRVFLCRKVYESRQKRILKNPL